MRLSSLVTPLSIISHLLLINVTFYYFSPQTYIVPEVWWMNVAWLLTALGLNFYYIARKDTFSSKFTRFLQQLIIFALAYFTTLAFIRIPFDPVYQLKVLGFLFVVMTIIRWVFFEVRKYYRLEGGNFVNVVVIGKDRNLKTIRSIFRKPELGYRYKGFFSNKPSMSREYLGNIRDFYDFMLQNEVDEIFCMVSQLRRSELRELIAYADNNLKKLKIIPDNKEIFTRSMNVELYGTIPILNLRTLPLDNELAKYTKRLFDIIFSSIVILFILSWLTPLLFILIKLESKGPLFFRQQRHGFNKRSFWCYKFRSMAVNEDADSKMSTKNDVRVTKIGKFLRKTSLDELPQFFNVLIGNMSVVGPRPHMAAHTEEYQKTVEKYLVRHFAKPGITGLAQVKGFRGEILKKADIINRVRMDIFYLEKWSLGLDINIILATIENAIKGEEKAY